MFKKSNKNGERPHFKVKKVRKMWRQTAYSFLQQRQRFEKSHHVIYTFIAGVGLIMFWYGIWEGLKLVPVLGHPVIAMAIGALILLVCGAYAYQFVGNKAIEFKEELEDMSDDIDQVVETLER